MPFFFRNIIVVLILLSGITITALMVVFDHHHIQDEKAALASEKLHHLATRIERTFNMRLAIVLALEAFAKAHVGMDLQNEQKRHHFQEMFDGFTASLDSTVSGILSMQLAPDGVVSFLSSPDRNSKAVDHDLLLDDNRHKQVIDIISQRGMHTVGPLNLLQGGVAFITRKAVFTSEGAFSRQRYINSGRVSGDEAWLDTIPEDFWGLATVLVDARLLFNIAGLPELEKDYRVAIRNSPGQGNSGEVFRGDASVFENASDQIMVTIPGGNWNIAIEYDLGLDPMRLILFILAGVFITGLMLVAFLSYHANERANLHSQAKSAFLSRMSHELRTPLNGILGFAQVLQLDRDKLTSDQLDNVNEIHLAGSHLLNLVNELLDLSRIQAGRMEINLERLDPVIIINTCMQLSMPTAQARGISINFVPPVKELIVMADANRLKQVLLNLLSNAVKYNRENGMITISITYQANGTLRICVADTGIGIARADMTYLFKPFERPGAVANIQGTGIGLVISRHLMELMDGDIGVESVVGDGSTFWIELPQIYDL